MATVTPYHAKFWAHELTRRAPADSVDRLATALVDAQVDLNPHQVDAALFAFRSPLSNLTIKKIPKTVLSRCEWGRDDYSLEVANLAQAPRAAGQQGLGFEE